MNTDSFWLVLTVAIVIKLAIVGAILYAWGGICFLFLRFWRPETPARAHDFLRVHYPFFVRASKQAGQITPTLMRKAGRRGWRFALLPMIGLGYSPKDSFGFQILVLLSLISLLFFGGLFFAYAWYGVRCLRLLGLNSLDAPIDKLSSLPPPTDVAG